MAVTIFWLRRQSSQSRWVITKRVRSEYAEPRYVIKTAHTITYVTGIWVPPKQSASFRTIKRFPVLGSYEDTRQAQTDVALYILFTNLVLNNYLNNFCQWSRIWLVVMTIGLSLWSTQLSTAEPLQRRLWINDRNTLPLFLVSSDGARIDKLSKPILCRYNE